MEAVTPMWTDPCKLNMEGNLSACSSVFCFTSLSYEVHKGEAEKGGRRVWETGKPATMASLI